MLKIITYVLMNYELNVKCYITDEFSFKTFDNVIISILNLSL